MIWGYPYDTSKWSFGYVSHILRPKLGFEVAHSDPYLDWETQEALEATDTETNTWLAKGNP